MKKLLVMLIVCMLPLVVACRLVENDDPGPTITPVAQLSFTPKITFPNTFVSPSIKALDLVFSFNNKNYRAKKATPLSNIVEVEFETVTETITVKSFTASVKYGGKELFTIPINFNVTQDDAVEFTQLNITVGSDGKVSVVLVTKDNQTFNQERSDQVNLGQILNSTLYVVSVKWVPLSGTSVELTATQDNIVEINTLTPKFEVTMSSAIASGPFEFECKNITDNSTVIYKNTDNDVKVVLSQDKKVILFEVKSNSSRKLEKGKTYQVTLKSNLYKEGSTTEYVSGITRYFKTAQNIN